MKLFAYITDPEQFMEGGDYNRTLSIHVCSSETMESAGWILLHEVEIHTDDIDIESLTNSALKKIDIEEQREVAEHEVKRLEFVNRRANLLSLPANIVSTEEA
jgi:hypothetical protein